MRNGGYRLRLDDPRTRTRLDDGRVRLQLPEDVGHCLHDIIELEPGLGVSRLHYQPSRPLVEESLAPHQGRVLVISMGLSGCSLYQGEDRSRLEFRAGHTTVSAFSAIRGERRYRAGESVSQLRLIADQALLGRYLGAQRAAALLGECRLQRLDARASTAAASVHASALLRHLQSRQPGHSRLALHIHALGLLSEQLDLLAPTTATHEDRRWSPGEVERIERVRDLIAEHLDSPLTLDYLASQAGMNRNKLKDGMLHLYGQTPAALLLALRMGKARALLEAGQRVSQVSWQVGYDYPGNFSAAFSRYYGQSPRAMFGKRATQD